MTDTTNKRPKISVIIIVYNTEKYLYQCLDSVINQTLKDIEIIVVNDCSLGNCIEIVNSYIEKDSRIKLINLETNGGTTKARAEGALDANGEYIQHVDSDDWLELDCCEKVYKSLLETNSDTCYISVQKIDQDGKIHPFLPIYNQILTKGEVFDKFIKFKFLDDWTQTSGTISYTAMQYITKREIAHKASKYIKDIYYINIMDDFLLVSIYMLFINKCVCIPYRGYNYRMNSGITSNMCHHMAYAKNIQSAYKALKEVLNIYNKESTSEKQKKEMYGRLIWHFNNWTGAYGDYPKSEQQEILSYLYDSELYYILLFAYSSNIEKHDIMTLRNQIKTSIGIKASIKLILRGIKQLIFSIIKRIYKIFNK